MGTKTEFGEKFAKGRLAVIGSRQAVYGNYGNNTALSGVYRLCMLNGIGDLLKRVLVGTYYGYPKNRLRLETMGQNYLPMRSRVAACIVSCLIATSTVVCANTIPANDAPLADTPTNVPPVGPKRVIISRDVAAEMLIHKVIPEYPKKAKKARISGIVTLSATITKTGAISDLHVVCGPEMLRELSLSAVREWKYRPYLLRGEPVEVQTTIMVVFELGDKKKLPYSQDSCPVGIMALASWW